MIGCATMSILFLFRYVSEGFNQVFETAMAFFNSSSADVTVALFCHLQQLLKCDSEFCWTLKGLQKQLQESIIRVNDKFSFDYQRLTKSLTDLIKASAVVKIPGCDSIEISKWRNRCWAVHICFQLRDLAIRSEDTDVIQSLNGVLLQAASDECKFLLKNYCSW